MKRIRQRASLFAAGVLAACQALPGAVLGPTAAPPQTVLPATPLTYPTLPPEWTATWTPVPLTATPTPARTATPVDTYKQRLAAAQPDIARALKLTNSGQYTAALDLWNQLITRLPEYPDGYYQRTRCLLHLAPAIRVKDDYRALQAQALADMDQALSLDTRNGDYFYERQAVYFNLAQLELYRVDQDYWQALSLADAQAALRFGTTIGGADREAAFRQIDAGHPEAAFDLFSHLPPAPGRTLVSDATLQEGLAESQFAQGFLDDALSHVNLALRLSPSEYRRRLKALILLSQGKPADALTQLNQLATNGTLCGCAYYIRALTYYELGKPKQAQADIDTGSTQTWERGGLRSYVLGLLAIDDPAQAGSGDTASAEQLIQEAQASLPRGYGPVLLKQITQKLDDLGVARLKPTPSSAVTAMPTPP